MEYGKRIREIRKLRGYKQEYIALKMDIKQQSYSSFELKAGDKKLKQIVKVAEILDVDPCLIIAISIPISKDTINMKFGL